MKNFIKEHKKELVICGVIAVGIVGGIAPWKCGGKAEVSKLLSNEAIMVLPNEKFKTIDLFVGNGSDATHIWALTVDEAKSMSEMLIKASKEVI